MPNLRDSNLWDRQLEDNLPDSRLSGHRRKPILWGRMLMEKVFCASCGADGGLITADWSPHVFYLCDECARTKGKLPVQEIPESKIRGVND